ncbi:DUF2226 domain-containing protein [Methanothermococcus sp.]|uniref:DUF2226 domain-containing protein n=1 Tax=Methanothermococcus sp. TaxID=2614238 RepID=UPI0025FE9D64|nr:DUF2226 domain-containing protein [Methanothermococcus sp.]
MGAKIVEGKFLKTGEDFEELIKNLQDFNGYLRLTIKKDNGFEEGYIFLENNLPVGYYYIYNNNEVFGKKAVDYIEEMKKNKSIVELYQYDESKLKLMKDLFKEMFLDKSESKAHEKEKEKILESQSSCKYQKIILDIPSGKPLKMGTSGDYKEYLENYRLLDVFKKDGSGFKRGYVVYCNKEPILAAYEDNNGVLFGNDACKFVKELLNDSDAIIDIYEYNIEKIDILTEYYPQIRLKKGNLEHEGSKSEPNTENLDEFISDLYKKKEMLFTMGEKEENNENDEPLNKEELLKKLGIKAPNDDMIDNLIKNTMIPESYELDNIKDELTEKISEFLKNQNDIQEYSIDISVEYNNRYVCNCTIKLKPKKIFGIVKKELNLQYIKDNIYNILNNYVINLDSKVSVELV